MQILIVPNSEALTWKKCDVGIRPSLDGQVYMISPITLGMKVSRSMLAILTGSVWSYRHDHSFDVCTVHICIAGSLS